MSYHLRKTTYQALTTCVFNNIPAFKHVTTFVFYNIPAFPDLLKSGPLFS